MKKVRIIAGTYGYHNARGRLEPKDRKSDPFFLDDTEADRLVSLGIAEIIAVGVATPKFDDETASTSENTSEAEGRKKGEESASGNTASGMLYAERPIYDGNTKASELREVGKNVGIKFSVGTTKEKMIAALDDYFDAYLSDSPSLSAEEPLV